MKLHDLTAFLDETLRLPEFSGDISNNGLQIEAGSEVQKAAFAVDAAQETIDMAVKSRAQLLFVHHGWSWGGNPRRWVGIDGKRFSTLFCNGISLYAAHLPLDAHPQLGNNGVLSGLISLEKRRPFFRYDGVDIGFQGELPEAQNMETLAAKLTAFTGGAPVFRGDMSAKHTKVAVVSGGGGVDSVMEAAAQGCSLLITGEMEHIMHHAAKESGVSIIALGHYASETTGPRTMMEFVRSRCGIEVEFLDAPTGL